MKITKGQLKRIIAEEHAVVYGTKRKTRRPVGRRKTAKKQYVNEAKRELINEIQAKAITNELMVEGFFGDLWSNAKAALGVAKDAAGEAGAAAAKSIGKTAQGFAKTASDMGDKSKAFLQGMKDAGNEKLAAMGDKFQEKIQQQIKEKIKSMTEELIAQIKKINPDFDEEEIKGMTANIVTPAAAEAIAECIRGEKRQRLIESKKRRQRRRR